uniref:Uncharacterized protein n=1 Tax=Manihot esculenta TaxID=3983 RepID=A0A2C9W259_MANES
MDDYRYLGMPLVGYYPIYHVDIMKIVDAFINIFRMIFFRFFCGELLLFF